MIDITCKYEFSSKENSRSEERGRRLIRWHTFQMSVAGHRKKTVYRVEERPKLLFLSFLPLRQLKWDVGFLLTAPRPEHPELGARAAQAGSLCSGALLSHFSLRVRYCLPARHMVRLIYFHKLLPQLCGARFTLLIVCVRACPYLCVQEEKARQWSAYIAVLVYNLVTAAGKCLMSIFNAPKNENTK